MEKENTNIQTIIELACAELGDYTLVCKELDDSLKKKYIKVDKDDEKYIDVLRYNILYYKKLIKACESMMDYWSDRGSITGINIVDEYMEKMNADSLEYMRQAMKSGKQGLDSVDKKIYELYDEHSGIAKIQIAENDYKVLNLCKDIYHKSMREISSYPSQYSWILETKMSTFKEEFRISVLDFIDTILFQSSEEDDYSDEALLNEEGSNNLEEDNLKSFKKYISMITNPEVLVKINNIYYKTAESEGLDEETIHQFTSKMKNYVSCTVLLMDYLPQEGKNYFINLFKLFGKGKINEEEFKECTERYIREHSFLDLDSWYDCQKNINFEYNIEKNKFFGNRNIPDDQGLGIEFQNLMEFLLSSNIENNIEDELEYWFESEYTKSENKNGLSKFTDKLFRSISKVSNKFKNDEDKYDEEYDDEYDDEYDEYDDEYDEYDSEYDEYDDEDDDKKDNIFSKIKNVFNKAVDEENLNEEEEEDGIYIENKLGINTGDSSRQEYDAIEILKKKELNKLKEERENKKELDKLKDERKIAERINSGEYNLGSDIELNLDEEDSRHVKHQGSNSNINSEDIYDDTIDGKNNVLSISDIQEEEEFFVRKRKLNEKQLDNKLRGILNKSKEEFLKVKREIEEKGIFSEKNSDNKDGIEEANFSSQENIYVDEEEKVEDSYKNPSFGIVDKKDLDIVDKKDSEIEKNISKTQVLNSDKIKRVTDKTTVLDFESIKKQKYSNDDKLDFKSEIDSYREKYLSDEIIPNNTSHDSNKDKKISKIEDTLYNIIEDAKNQLENPEEKNMNFEYDSESEYNVFEELEAMKAMKTEGINISPVSDKKSSKVDLSSFGRKKMMESGYDDRSRFDSDNYVYDDEDVDEETEGIMSSFKSTLKNGIGSIKNKIDIDKDDQSYPRKKMVRDVVIVSALGVVIFFGYIFMIKGFKVPTVEETNKKTQIEVSKKQSQEGNSKESSSNESTSTTTNTTEISQKTEAERAKENAESQASKLDREADMYSGGKGIYYTVFVGATKSKDGAESVATNFTRRGVSAEVVRNGGYYMLKVGSYNNYNQAYMASRRISAKGIQNYIATRNKYFELKIDAFVTRAPYLSKDQLTTDYNDLKNQISSTGKNAQYLKNLDEAYNDAVNGVNQ